jgi:phosphoribosylformimino-5-aminoimidazole carboxamide ribotide isomerase
MGLTIYPAIDLRDGQVVRLQLGDPDRQTVFDHDPVASAQRWIADGAVWLHVVNLDGAFAESGRANWQILPQITACGAQVQFGGGMRAIADIEQAFAAGVERVVLGTIAVEQPDLVKEAVTRFGPGHVAVGIDARDGIVRTRGWQTGTTLTPQALARQMGDLGVQTIIYTDISRDGVLSGVNTQATAELARTTGLDVIASGGVAGLDDVERTAATMSSGVRGLIIGRALYDGRISLADALALAGE